MPRLVVALLLTVAAAAAAIVANLALLDYASANRDPVGKLSIRSHLPSAPASVIRPEHGRDEHARNDD